jgi:hypothetical protein
MPDSGAVALDGILPPQLDSDIDLVLMCRIDELHLEHPFAGSWMLRDMLKREGYSVGREHGATLMQKIDLSSSRSSDVSKDAFAGMPHS